MIVNFAKLFMLNSAKRKKTVLLWLPRQPNQAVIAIHLQLLPRRQGVLMSRQLRSQKKHNISSLQVKLQRQAPKNHSAVRLMSSMLVAHLIT